MKENKFKKILLLFANNEEIRGKWISIASMWYVFISLLGFFRIRDIITKLGTNKLIHISSTLALILFVIFLSYQSIRYITTKEYIKRLFAKEMMKLYIKNLIAFYLLFGYIAFYYEAIYRGAVISNYKIINLVIATYLLIYLPAILHLIIEVFGQLKKLFITSKVNIKNK